MEPIVTGLASYGMSGSLFHAPFISIHPGFELKFIVERTKNLSKERYPDVRILRSFDALIAEPEVELIVINTPDVTHYELTMKALLAGKHVVVEKPFVFTAAEGRELIELADAKSLMLSVFQNRRWDGDFLTIQKILSAGVLGRVVEFSSAYQRYRNYVQQGAWKEMADNRVGITYNLGSHMVDQAFVLFGKPEAVFAIIDKVREDTKVDDYYHIQLLYPQVKVSLRASFLVKEETPRYFIHGTEGSYVKYGIDTQEEMLKVGISPRIADWGKEPESQWGILHTNHSCEKFKTERGNYLGFYEEIYKAMRLGKASSTAASQIINVIQILEAAFESSDNRKVVFL